MSIALLVDFGSTFTKLIAADLESSKIVGRATGPSTVSTDVMAGLSVALERLHQQLGEQRYAYKLASSSAAGGLKMVVIGLVPDLTAEAAKRAALGAGAKVVGVFSYGLSSAEWESVRRLSPDIVLLAGGTDGGDRKTILANARALAALPLSTPTIVAGNKTAADEVMEILTAAGTDARVTENVMPELGTLNVEPARDAIRQVFIERITQAKGIKQAESFVDQVLMPTPMAVLQGAELLAEGPSTGGGFGELLVVDVGGATTDVHSIAAGAPSQGGVVPKGLPEPYVKRTVEGDLGLRHNALSIVEEAGVSTIQELLGDQVDVHAQARALQEDVERRPRTAQDWALDEALATAAIRLGVTRHVGRLEETYTPLGTVMVQYGKDLRKIPTVAGTGGPLVYAPHPERVLSQALSDSGDPLSLRPQSPALFLDTAYCLYAVGLLAEVDRDIAFGVGQRYIRPIGTPNEVTDPALLAG